MVMTGNPKPETRNPKEGRNPKSERTPAGQREERWLCGGSDKPELNGREKAQKEQNQNSCAG